MKYKIIILMLAILLVIPIILAEPSFTFQKGENITLCIPVFNSDNSEADASTSCYLTLKDSQMNILLEDLSMYINGTGLFCIDINNSFDSIGEYPTTTRCDDGADYSFSSFVIEITPTGKKITSGQGFTSIGLIIAIILLSGLFAFFGFKFAETEKLFPIALFFMLISLVLGVYTIQLGYIYTRDILYPISTEGLQFKIYIGIIWGLLGMGFIALLFFILKTLKEFKVRKSSIRYGEGWDPRTMSYK